MGDLFAIITAICWSSAVILFDLASKRFQALHLNAIKNSIGVCGFFITIVIFSIPVPNFSIHDLSVLFISGIFGIMIADVLFLDSLRRIGSGLSAVVSTLYTPTIFILAFFMFHETISTWSYLGGALVIFGIILSVYKTPNRLHKKDLYIGIIFGVIAQLLTAFSVLMVKPIMEDTSVVVIALFRFGIGLSATVIIILIREGFSIFYQKIKQGLNDKIVVIGSILGTYLSVIFWLAGYKYTLAGRAAIYNQLSTIFIIVMARVFLKETLGYRKIIGVCISIIGAIMVTVKY